MIEWTNERMNDWMNEWTNEWMNEWMNEELYRLGSHGHHGPKRRELAQHVHSRRSHAFPQRFTSTQLVTTTLMIVLGSHQRGGRGCNTNTHTSRTHSLPHLHQHSYNHVDSFHQRGGRGCNTHTHTSRTHSPPHLHQHSYNPVDNSPGLSPEGRAGVQH